MLGLVGLGPMGMPGGPITQGAKAAPGAMKRIPGKMADALTPSPAPEIPSLAKKAEAMGIELRPDMMISCAR